jgi:negative regulator of sigma-B (phosphoserine phosphatase)
VILQRKYPHSKLSIYQKSKQGQEVCGDGYFTHETDQYLLVAIADGLGSGQEAHHAASKAVECLTRYHYESVQDIVKQCNQALQQTRGVVLGVMKLEIYSGTVTFVGIGNIQLMFFPEDQKTIRAISRPGYVNGRPLQYRVERFTYPRNAPFLMHSDGLYMTESIQNAIRSMTDPEKGVAQIINKAPVLSDDITLIVGRSLCS